MDFTTTHEKHCFNNADHFTAVRGRIGAGRTNVAFDSLDAAKKYASGFGDGRTMIYAVTATGLSAHITNG